MKYHFLGKVIFEDGAYLIKIPFNVWEVCTGQGSFPVEVVAEGREFTCDLVPLGKGLYNIPLTEELANALPEMCDVTFRVIEHVANVSGSSPYSLENPIRRVDSMKLITQPNDGLCGQTCIAMLAGITLDEACEVMHCRDWQANMGRMIISLDYLGIAHAETIEYASGDDVNFPKCAILMEKMGRFSHYLVWYDGTYYDPTEGILESFDKNNLVGYLEIKTF